MAATRRPLRDWPSVSLQVPRPTARETGISPVTWQLQFVVLFGIGFALGTTASAGPSARFPAAATVAIAMVAAATIWVLLLELRAQLFGSRVTSPRLTRVVVPVLVDIGAVALTPFGVGFRVGTSMLFIVPVVWIVREASFRGVGIATSAVTLFLTLPWVTIMGLHAAGTAVAFLAPLTTLIAGTSLAASIEKATRDRALLDAQETELTDERLVNERLMESLHVAVALLGPDGQVRAANDLHQQLVDTARAEERRSGRGPWLLADGTTRVTTAQAYVARAQAGDEFEQELVWLDLPRQPRRAFWATAQAIRSSDGQLRGSSITHSDVTDLVRATQIKEDLIGQLSHELRTPLTSILANSELLLDDSTTSAKHVARLKAISRNADRLGKLISDLLLVAHVETGALSLDALPVDLSNLLNDVVAKHRSLVAATPLVLSSTVASHLRVTGDAHRLEEAFSHLLDNAVKFSQGRPGTITLSARKENGLIRCVLTDQGRGIAASDQSSIFNSFYRSHEAVTDAIPGAGLGLSITKAIIEAHRGSIEIAQASAHSGTEVTVLLPAP